ncbi:serine hydrolase [Sphingomonas sp. 28-63-12]|uniref:serine hydrolase domain-containing protein n=1 Tax=Sphingomonas sp. 28-63-12 TaxID=1970434 RepID=UPI000BCFBC02|nr:MAG: hypothetical protein B7Y47_11180 [Sphingomonas sp. 28-63-12]
MKNWLVRWGIIAGASAGLAVAASAAPAAIDGRDLTAFVDGVMDARMRQDHLAGAAVVVVADGKVIVSRGYGYADVARRVPVDPATTMFRIASVTKLFTATAAMQQAEQGKLPLTVDIGRYLDFPVRRVSNQPVTMANLLTHTAGFEEGVFGMFVHPNEARPLGAVLKATLPALVRAPGQQSAYSNHGMGLAGYLVERASGERYQDYLARHIFAPLGMTHSTAEEPVPARFAANVAKGYSFAEGTLREAPQEIVNVAPAGAISASAGDMGRFMLAQLDGGRLGAATILSPSSTADMQRCHFRADPRTGCMGYGFYEQRIAGQRAIAHGGDINYAHSELVLVPDRRIGIFVAYNSAEAEGARDDFARQLLGHLFPAPPRLADYAGPETADDYAGAYLMNRRPYSTMFAALGLGLQLSAEATDKRHLMLFDKSWRQVGPGVFAADAPGGDDTRLIFRRNAQGKVTGAMISAYPYAQSERIGWIDTMPAAAFAVAGWAIFGSLLAALGWRHRRTPGGARRAIGLLVASAGLVLAGIGCIASRLIFAPEGPYGAGYTMPPAFVAGVVLLNLAVVALVIGAVLVALGWRSFARRRHSLVVIGYIVTGGTLLALLARWQLVGFAF